MVVFWVVLNSWNSEIVGFRGCWGFWGSFRVPVTGISGDKE